MRYSDSYIKTFHTGSASDMLEIETIRKAIKVVNADLRRFKYGSRQKKDGYGSQYYEQYRVALKARGPRTIHARADGRHPRAYDQSLPLRHAERIDLYIYQR
jgi:hypothetical protein